MKKSKKIKKYVKDNNLRFKKIAQDIGVSQIHLNAVLCDRRNMTTNILKKLYDYINQHYQHKKQEQDTWQKEAEELLRSMEKDLSK